MAFVARLPHAKRGRSRVVVSTATDRPHHVLGVRDHLQMGRVHACPIAAQVVEFLSALDRTYPVLVSNPVWLSGLPPIPHGSIPSPLIRAACPHPTTTGIALVHLCRESLKFFSSHC
jgi:hypothetical protein